TFLKNVSRAIGIASCWELRRGQPPDDENRWKPLGRLSLREPGLSEPSDARKSCVGVHGHRDGWSGDPLRPQPPGGFGMRKGLLTVVVALASTAALFVAHTASAGSGVVGHLYVNDNTGGVNTIAGFDRHADGTLTPM